MDAVLFLWTSVLSIFLSVIIFGAAYLKWTFGYWKRKGFPHQKPIWPFGNDENPIRRTKNLNFIIKEFYDEMKSKGYKHAGFYRTKVPVYIPIDPDYIKCVMAKDFQYFNDRGFYHNEEADPLTANLFAIGGDKWKNLRKTLNPNFTSGKLKLMFQTLLACGPPMLEYVDKLESKNEPVDIKEILGFFTTDVIGSCFYGLECNSFKDPNSQFARIGFRMFSPSYYEVVLKTLCANFPKFSKSLGLSNLPKHLTKFYWDVVKETVEFRENNSYTRKDFMQFLIDLKNAQERILTVEQIAAQTFGFFVAGFETSATTMTFCCLELAKHEDIQEMVRNEINEVMEKYGWKISYESLMDMKYLTQVIEETLRKYPPLPFITRKTTNDYKIPDTELILDKDTMVFIPAYALHHDQEFYPEPDKFDPDRFSDKNKRGRHQFVHIPFGEGPRICIGLRFGMIQVKVGMTLLLQKYRFTLNSKTTYPVEYNPYSFILTSKDPIYLDVHKLTG